MEISAVKKVTLVEQIMEQIASNIISGELKPGEKLPNERELAERFQVTRSRIREALRALSLIGMIIIKPGGGSFVADRKVEVPADTVIWMYHNELHNIDDIYEARKLIETAVYLSFFDNRNQETLKNMANQIANIKKAAQDNIDSEEFLKLLNELDLYVGNYCGNSIYSKLMQTIVLLRKESALKVLQLSNSKKMAAENRFKIYAAIKSNNKKELEVRLEEFFASSVQNLYLEKPIEN